MSGLATLGGSGINSTEIIDIGTTTSQCENVQAYPMPITLVAVGGLGFKNEPVVCGSRLPYYESIPECYSLINGSWKSYEFNMTVSLGFGMSFTFNPFTYGNGRILVVHSTNASQTSTSIETLSPSGWKQAPIELPHLYAYGCTVAINSTTYLIVSVNGTIFYNVETNIVTNGKPITFPRTYMRCDL